MALDMALTGDGPVGKGVRNPGMSAGEKVVTRWAVQLILGAHEP